MHLSRARELYVRHNTSDSYRRLTRLSYISGSQGFMIFGQTLNMREA